MLASHLLFLTFKLRRLLQHLPLCSLPPRRLTCKSRQVHAFLRRELQEATTLSIMEPQVHQRKVSAPEDQSLHLDTPPVKPSLKRKAVNAAKKTAWYTSAAFLFVLASIHTIVSCAQCVLHSASKAHCVVKYVSRSCGSGHVGAGVPLVQGHPPHSTLLVNCAGGGLDAVNEMEGRCRSNTKSLYRPSACTDTHVVVKRCCCRHFQSRHKPRMSNEWLQRPTRFALR